MIGLFHVLVVLSYSWSLQLYDSWKFAASRSAAYTDSDSSTFIEELTGQNNSSQGNYTLNKFKTNQLPVKDLK